MPVLFQRVESAAVAVATVVGFVTYGFAWWWLLVLFLAWDLSMIGYLASPKAGAWTYNTAHSYIGPGLLLSHALLTGAHWSAFLALTWAFHIAADRLLGYGLKFTTGFHHTHLGNLGSPPEDHRSLTISDTCSSGGLIHQALPSPGGGRAAWSHRR